MLRWHLKLGVAVNINFMVFIKNLRNQTFSIQFPFDTCALRDDCKSTLTKACYCTIFMIFFWLVFYEAVGPPCLHRLYVNCKILSWTAWWHGCTFISLPVSTKDGLLCVDNMKMIFRLFSINLNLQASCLVPLVNVEESCCWNQIVC